MFAYLRDFEVSFGVWLGWFQAYVDGLIDDTHEMDESGMRKILYKGLSCLNITMQSCNINAMCIKHQDLLLQSADSCSPNQCASHPSRSDSHSST